MERAGASLIRPLQVTMGECDNAAFISCYLYRGEASNLGMPPLILRSAAWILDSVGFTDSTPTHGSGQSEEPWLPPFRFVVPRERMTPIALDPSPVYPGIILSTPNLQRPSLGNTGQTDQMGEAKGHYLDS